MEWVQKRKWFTPTTTISQLYLGRGAFAAFECYVLEDLTRAIGEVKVPGKTAIAFGRYRVDMRTVSPRFSKLAGHDVILPRLLDVPGFQGILIHTGNGAGDTEGCLLTGRQRQADNLRVLESRLAFEPLFAKLCAADARDEEIWWTVENAGQPVIAA